MQELLKGPEGHGPGRGRQSLYFLGPHLKVLQACLQFCLPNGRPIQSFQSEGWRGTKAERA